MFWEDKLRIECYNYLVEKPKLFLATDHAGFEHKNTLRDYMIEHNAHGYEVVDLGAFQYDPSDDYPGYIARAAQAVGRNPDRDRAIIFGGSGQGEAIVANKYNNIRATVYYGYDESIITLAREHNNTNILSIGARFVSDNDMIRAVEQWLVIPFRGEERHQRRLDLISTLERKRFWKNFLSWVRSNK